MLAHSESEPRLTHSQDTGDWAGQAVIKVEERLGIPHHQEVKVALIAVVLAALSGCSAGADVPAGPGESVSGPVEPGPVSAAEPKAQVCTGQTPTEGSEASRGTIGKPLEIAQVDNETLYDDVIEITIGEPEWAETSGQVEIAVQARNISGAPTVAISSVLLVANGRSCPLASVSPGLSRLAPGQAARQDVSVTYLTLTDSRESMALVLIDPVEGVIRAEWPISAPSR